MSTHIPVLIVGGGLNGLTAAALLAHHGIDCAVVERHADTSIQYKFAGISPRSMEIFRGLGLETEIRANRTGDQQGGGIARGRHLADPDIQWGGPAWPDASPYTSNATANESRRSTCLVATSFCLQGRAIGAGRQGPSTEDEVSRSRVTSSAPAMTCEIPKAGGQLPMVSARAVLYSYARMASWLRGGQTTGMMPRGN
jgi:hypothetical protein